MEFLTTDVSARARKTTVKLTKYKKHITVNQYHTSVSLSCSHITQGQETYPNFFPSQHMVILRLWSQSDLESTIRDGHLLDMYIYTSGLVKLHIQPTCLGFKLIKEQ